MARDDQSWTRFERWLEQVAAGRVRKNGDPMVGHWIRIGRALRSEGADDIAACGGYAHDLVEDIEDLREADMVEAFEALLGNRADALVALQLVHDCSYQPSEYQLERDVAEVQGARAGKDARKAAACARWIAHQDPRVHIVKIADVCDNDTSCESVSGQFAMEYRGWALPLRSSLEQVRDGIRSAAAPGPR